MKSKPRVVLPVCLAIALTLLCWHPVQHVRCYDQTPAPQPQFQSAQEVCPEEPKEGADIKVVESWESHAPSSSEHGVQTEGDPAEEDEALTQDSLAVAEVHDEAVEMEMEEAVAEPELGSASDDPEQDPDLPAPEPSITPEEEAPLALATEHSFSSPTSHDSSPSSVTEAPMADASPAASIIVDPSTADCDAGENPPFDSDLTSLPVVLENTSALVAGKGTKPGIDPTLGPSGQGANASRRINEQGIGPHIATETDPPVHSKDPEDIPTFDEWKKKMIEVEREKSQSQTHASSNGGSHVGKKVQKNFNNYASVECGAKILSANSEAKSTSAILMENMDLYMLNPCSNKIWFVIELCEPIQVKQLDIANFELFSSTPKDFLVSISDRYPTHKWVKLGTFHGRDERTVQSFPLDEHLYAKYVKMFTKYIKVELLSHFGSEHYCPLSLIRVFGTSMVEEYEEISDPSERLDFQDEDYDYPPGYVPSEAKSSKNLIGSAKDAILNMVNNIAANVLGGNPEEAAMREGNFSEQELNVTETTSTSQLSSTTTSPTVLETMELDEPDLKESSKTPTQEAPIPTAPVPETLTTEAPVTEAPTPPPPEEDRIVTLLLEEDDEPDPSFTLLEREEEEQAREAKNSGVHVEESLIYCEESLSSSCAAFLQEYLLQHCSAMLALQRRRKRKPELDSQPHTQSEHLQPSPSTNGTESLPHAKEGQTSERETPPSQDETTRLEEVTPATVVEEKPFTEHLDLAPSQTSALPKPKATPAVDFSKASDKDLPEEKAPHPEKSKGTPVEGKRTPLPTSTTSVITSSDVSLDQNRKPPLVEQSIPGTDTSTLTSTTDAVEQTLAPIAPLSTLTEQPVSPAVETKSSVLEETQTASPSSELLEGSMSAVEPRGEVLLEEVVLAGSSSNGQPLLPSSSSSDFSTEMQNATELANGNSNQVHGSGQKESVFMRLNNRIKALEMNMSLSGRYLEQLSQRYRKQMEEMQRAFNKTIIKLQNTSRIAEEQDQRQTESIQTLQGQLENVTQMVLDLYDKVSQLQREVSDRQSYLLVCLVLCLLIGLMLCVSHCRLSATPPATDPDTSIPKSYSYCCPERTFSGDEDMSQKRRASYPLLQSSFQIPTTEGPADDYNVDTLRCSPVNKKKKRCKTKPAEKLETLNPSALAVALVANGGPQCNGAPQGLGPPPFTFRDPPSEGSSEVSSQSDEPSFCGMATCSRLCDSLPPPRSRAEKRAYKRRHSKPCCTVVELLKAPRRSGSTVGPIPTLQDLMRGNKEMSAGTLGVMVVSGPS